MTPKKTTQKTTEKRDTRRVLTGVVARKSGDKTVAVEVSRVVVHPMYQKRRMSVSTYLVHDPKNEAKVGDKVRIKESRPLSAHKRWIIIEAAK